jgi:2',3'-cyclic-nucleotide 2'-phosphodiesterase (5'-nucleotidase family)
VVRLLHYSDLENVYDDPERVARLAGVLDEHDDGKTVVVGTGDNLAPGVLSLVTRGGCGRPFFEAVGAAIETFGNHDFDYGLDRAAELVGESPQQWVSANVGFDGDRFGTESGVKPYLVREIDETTVGFIGVTDPATTEMTPAAADLNVTDPVTAVQEAVADLRPAVEYVCVCSHCGALDERIARACDVDVVLGGHVHDERIVRIAGTLCTRPNAGGHRICEVDLDADEARFRPTASGSVDGEVEAIYEELVGTAGLNEVVGTVADPIERTRETRLGGECRAGNFVADAYRWIGETDCGLHNAGGLRDGPALAGEIRVADLVSLVPFDERVVVAELTGRELVSVLEEADTARHGRRGWYAHLSGIDVDYDTKGRTVLDCRIDGESIDPGESYTLATSAYLLATDHEFPTLAPTTHRETLDVQWEVLAAYVRTAGIDPRIENRITFRGGPIQST